MTKLEELRAEKAAYLEEIELNALKRELRWIEQDANRALPDLGTALVEAYGDVVDTREYLRDDSFGYPQTPVDVLGDRREGIFRPHFESEQELAAIRGQGRILGTSFSTGICVRENLINYTVGTGCEVKCLPLSEQTKELARRVQKCVDEFLDLNDFCGNLDQDLFGYSIEDGEFFLRLVPDGWKCLARRIEPSEVTQPMSPRGIEDWLTHAGHADCDSFESSWRFGVHTAMDDVEVPYGYHVVRDTAGSDWDYLAADYVEHYKRNVPRNVKRGLSDFYPIRHWLEGAAKLGTNVVTTSAIQAAVAFLKKYAPGTNSSRVGEEVTNLAAEYRRVSSNAGQTQTDRNIARLRAGTTLHVSNGTEYTHGPMGQASGPNFVPVIQAALRLVGVRHQMAEYMISPDASNANYASTLVAEAPFVKSREREQRRYISTLRRIIWKAVKHACKAGFFGDADFDAIERYVDITVSLPEVQSRDKMAEAQRIQIETQVGVLSIPSAQEQLGYDPEHEKARGAGAKTQPEQESDGGQPANPFSRASILEAKNCGVGHDDPDDPDLFEAGDCGTGDGGFKPGNDCGSGRSPSVGSSFASKAKAAKTRKERVAVLKQSVSEFRAEKEKDFSGKLGELEDDSPLGKRVAANKDKIAKRLAGGEARRAQDEVLSSVGDIGDSDVDFDELGKAFDSPVFTDDLNDVLRLDVSKPSHAEFAKKAAKVFGAKEPPPVPKMRPEEHAAFMARFSKRESVNVLEAVDLATAREQLRRLYGNRPV